MTPWLRGAGWRLEFPNKMPIQGKAGKIPRQLGFGEAVLSDPENGFRAQSGHTLLIIFYQCWEEPAFFSLPVIIFISLCFLPLRFPPSPSSARPVKSVWVLETRTHFIISEALSNAEVFTTTAVVWWTKSLQSGEELSIVLRSCPS